MQSVTDRLRCATRDILARMPALDRREHAAVLAPFTAAAGEPTKQDLWALGWVTDTPTTPARPTATVEQLITE